MSGDPRRDRFVELLADRALVGLGPDEEAELAALVRAGYGGVADPASFERAAAAVAIAGVATKYEEMPSRVAARLEEQAMAALAAGAAGVAGAGGFGARQGGAGGLADSAATVLDTGDAGAARGGPPKAMLQTVAMPDRPLPPPPPSTTPSLQDTRMQDPRTRGASTGDVVPLAPRRSARVFATLGWVAAAACLMLAIGAWYVRGKPETVAVLSAAAQREQLLARAGTARLAWTTTKDPTAAGASGDVVWNAAEQKGFMRFHGLAKNDARSFQYQLWIFDKTRDDRYPVDGGVFDVGAAGGAGASGGAAASTTPDGDTIVPIKARLPVGEVALFAVTVEKPGGVVVSKRERIVVTAKPAG
jgi:hypothetical protein